MEFLKQLLSYFTDEGVHPALAIAYLIVSALLVVMSVVALGMWIKVAIRYSRSNRVHTASGKNAMQIARETLDRCGLSHVKVKRASFLRAWIFGNSYGITSKTIYLRRNICEKDTVTAVGLALQKVGIAKLCESGDKKARTRNFLQLIGLFGPFLFVPVILIGFVLDVVLFAHLGVFSVVGICVGILIVALGLIVTLLNIPVEKQANRMALEMIDQTGFFNAEERALLEKVFDTYITAYICDFIVEVLRMIQLILEIAINAQKKN